jgi:hypothetical protein
LKNPAPSGGDSSLPKEKIFVIRPHSPRQVAENARAVAFIQMHGIANYIIKEKDSAVKNMLFPCKTTGVIPLFTLKSIQGKLY